MADYVAVQKRLNELGQDPPLTTDGVYGPKTRAAVIAFQQSKGLTPDGIVGPKTCAALGIEVGSAPASSQEAMSYSTTHVVATGNPADIAAYQIARRAAPDMPEAQLQYVLAVARGEGGYGHGWGNPSAKTIEVSQSFGITGYEGKDSNNWGATQGSGDAGSFPHVDYHADGTPYLGYYKKWSTPEKGFLDIAHVILNGGKRGQVGALAIQNAISKGSLRDAVYAQHANGYFELNPDAYLSAVMRNYASLANANGWKQLLGQFGPAAAAGIGIAGLVVTGGLGYFGWRLFRALVLKS